MNPTVGGTCAAAGRTLGRNLLWLKKRLRGFDRTDARPRAVKIERETHGVHVSEQWSELLQALGAPLDPTRLFRSQRHHIHIHQFLSRVVLMPRFFRRAIAGAIPHRW